MNATLVARRLDELTDRIAQLEHLLTDRFDDVLDIDGAAALLGRSRNALYQLTSTRNGRSPEVPHFKKCGRLYFRRSELLAWMTSDRVHSHDEVAEEARRLLAETKGKRRRTA